MNAFTSIDERVLTLPNGQLVEAEKLEKEIRRICHYVHHVALAVKDGKYLVAMIFPNKSLFSNPDYEKSPEEGCFCPRNLKELGKCLSGCMHTINVKLLPGYAKINSAVIVNTELSVIDDTLTPAQTIISENVIKKYKAHLKNLFGDNIPVQEEVFNMKFF